TRASTRRDARTSAQHVGRTSTAHHRWHRPALAAGLALLLVNLEMSAMNYSVTRRTATAMMASTLVPLAQASETTYPSRPVTMIVPFAAGNVTDGIARLLADRLTVSLAQAVVVENKPGASGGIGLAALSRAQ